METCLLGFIDYFKGYNPPPFLLSIHALPSPAFSDSIPINGNGLSVLFLADDVAQIASGRAA